MGIAGIMEVVKGEKIYEKKIREINCRLFDYEQVGWRRATFSTGNRVGNGEL